MRENRIRKFSEARVEKKKQRNVTDERAKVYCVGNGKGAGVVVAEMQVLSSSDCIVSCGRETLQSLFQFTLAKSSCFKKVIFFFVSSWTAHF